MKSLERIFWIIITVWITILYFTKEPKFDIHTVEIPGDSVFNEVMIPYDSLIYVINTVYDVDTLWVHDTAFLPTDTSAILADYFKMVSYDSIAIQDNLSMTIWAEAKVTQNRLYEFDCYSKNNRYTTIINNYPTKNYIGIGGLVGVGIATPLVSFHKSKHEYGVGYNFYKENKGFVFKYAYKIPLKNK